jgi:hypothetical protein
MLDGRESLLDRLEGILSPATGLVDEITEMLLFF